MANASLEEISSLFEGLNLASNQNRMQSLMDIRMFLYTQAATSIQNTIRISDMKYLFQSFDSENIEEVELACSIINTILSHLDPLDVLNELSSSFQFGLTHTNKNVVEVVIKQLLRMLKSPNGIDILIESSEIIRSVILLLASDDLSLASSACQFLSYFGCNSVKGANMMLSTSTESLLTVLQNVMTKNEAVRLRVYEVVCNIGKSSNQLLDICSNSTILTQFFREFQSRDILLKATCCTMLADFASSAHVLDYLVQFGVVSDMAESIKQAASDPFGTYFINGAVKFFGKVCLYKGVKYLEGIFSNFLPLLFHMILEDNDFAIKLIAIETLGVVAESSDGKILLSTTNNIDKVINKLSNLSKTSDEYMKETISLTFCSLFDIISAGQDLLLNLESITSSWFFYYSNNSIQPIVDLCKYPTEKLSTCGFNMLISLASLTWALRLMKQHPFLVEFLLDRSNLHPSTARNKYKLIKRITEHRQCAEVFGNEYFINFRKYLNPTHHNSETIPQVAVNSGS